jgi:Rod binding domain-containing protein
MVNNINPLSPAGAAAAPANGKTQNSPQKVKDAAQQFEALMIEQLLKTAREASSDGGGWLGTGEDQPGQIAMDMAEQQFASTMAKQGGFGLTTTITRDLERAPGVKAR